MEKKTMNVSMRGIEVDFWQTVKEFALRRRISAKALVIIALDQYMLKYPPDNRNQKKEVEVHGNTRR